MHPHYLKFLHGNFLGLEGQERSEFVDSVRRALGGLEPDQVERLLRIAWREQLTAAWFAGLKNWSQFTDRIGELLLQSLTSYAGQGYCFALACFANSASVEYLTRYLDTYLRQPEKQYDQLWAITALIWVDRINATNHSHSFLVPEGLWERFLEDGKYAVYSGWNLEEQNQRFEEIMTFRNNLLDQ